MPLTPKAFDILLVLIEKSGRTIEKNELMRAVWRDTVVEENNLGRNISSLRKALGESPHEHQYVLTVSGRGYRFIGGVKELTDGEIDSVVEKYRPGRRSSSKKRKKTVRKIKTSGKPSSKRHFQWGVATNSGARRPGDQAPPCW